MKVHELKLDTKYFNDVKNGYKTFEIRKNDREYQVGDLLSLSRFSNGKYSRYTFDGIYSDADIHKADTILMQVTYITDYEQKKGYVVMAIRPYNGAE